MGDPSAKSTEIHVLILSDDEYIFWVASFEDEADAKAAAKIANDGLRTESGHRFYVDSYPAYTKGTVPTLDQIKAASADNGHECDEMWQLTLEERLEDVDPTEVVREIARRAEGTFSGFVRPITEAQFNLLSGERRVAIDDWTNDPYADILSVPPELKPDGQLPIPPAPGQQELPIQ